MAEYVNRKNALMMFNRYWRETEHSLVLDMKQAFLELPTIEADPVRHGRWLPYQTPIETSQSGWICNQCSGVAHDVSNGDTDYCPNCGAKMDGGADNG